MATIHIESSAGPLTMELPSQYATEETLRKLLDFMSKGSKQKGEGITALDDKADDASESLEDLEKATEAHLDVLARETRTLKDVQAEHRRSIATYRGLSSTMTNFSSGMLSGLHSFSTASAGSTKAITSSVDLMAGGFHGFFKVLQSASTALIPSVGMLFAQLLNPVTLVAGVIAGIVAAGVSFVAAQFESMREAGKKIQDSGVFFTSGIAEASTSAQLAGLTLGRFAEAVANAKEDIGLLGGANGIKKVANVMASFSKETQENFMAMGYTREEQFTAIAAYTAKMNLMGKKLSIEQLSKESQGYLTNLKDLQRLTGVDIKTQLAKQRKLQIDFDWQAHTRQYADGGEAVTNLMTGLSNLPDNIQNSMKGIFEGVITEETAQFRAVYPKLAADLEEYRQIGLQRKLTDSEKLEWEKKFNNDLANEGGSTLKSYENFNTTIGKLTGPHGQLVSAAAAMEKRRKNSIRLA
jgi:hypothetical protein